MVKHTSDAIAAIADATDGLRSVTLLIVAAIAKQDGIDAPKFMADISSMIEGHYRQDEEIPTVVLDFRAELARALSAKK